MNITQAVEIPASRRLVLDVPREVPAGQVILTFTPVPERTAFGERMSAKEAIEKCRGIGKRLGSKLTSDKSIEYRREDAELEESEYLRRHHKVEMYK